MRARRTLARHRRPHLIQAPPRHDGRAMARFDIGCAGRVPDLVLDRKRTDAFA
jgi:hypothetical protein